MPAGKIIFSKLIFIKLELNMEKVFVNNREYLKVINKPKFIKKLNIKRVNLFDLEWKGFKINSLEIK